MYMVTTVDIDSRDRAKRVRDKASIYSKCHVYLCSHMYYVPDDIMVPGLVRENKT